MDAQTSIGFSASNVPQVPFTEVVRDVSGGNGKVKVSEYSETGDLPVIDQGQAAVAGFTNDPKKAFVASNLPVVLFGDHTKAIKYANFEFAMGADGVKVLKPSRYCDEKYLYHFLRQVRLPEVGYSRHFKFLKRLKIPLPPLEEQHHIAAVLDKADALRAKRREAIAKLDQLLQSVFLEMFGDPIANPNSWTTKSLESVSKKLTRGPYGGSLKKEIFVESGYKVYQQQNAIYNDFSLGNYYIDEAKFKKMKSFSIAPNDLLISCSGTMGRVTVVPETAAPGVINQALLKVTPSNNLVRSEFLADFIRTDRMQNHIFGFSRGTGLHNFPPMSEVRSLKLFVPPIADQDNYLRIKNKIKYMSSLMGNERINSLFGVLQQQAFTGQL